MSYILDALKKVEQKRDRHEPPRLLTFSGELPPGQKRRPRWPYLLAGLLIINAGIMVWWLGFSSRGKVQPLPRVRSEQALRQPAAAAPLEKTAEERVLRQERIEVPQKTVPKPLPAPVVEKETGAALQSAAVKTPENNRPRHEQKPPAERKTSAGDKIYALNELPATIKSALPEFKVSGHAYSPDRQSRVTRVNEKILQEGQELSPGLKVEEITPDGIIFSYQGCRFRVAADGRL